MLDSLSENRGTPGRPRFSVGQKVRFSVYNEETEEREYKPLEMIRDNYPKYVITTDYLLQKRNGIQHVNLMDFMKAEKTF